MAAAYRQCKLRRHLAEHLSRGRTKAVPAADVHPDPRHQPARRGSSRGNSNYATLLTVWNRVFGSFIPALVPARIGLDGLDPGNGLNVCDLSSLACYRCRGSGGLRALRRGPDASRHERPESYPRLARARLGQA